MKHLKLFEEYNRPMYPGEPVPQMTMNVKEFIKYLFKNTYTDEQIDRVTKDFHDCTVEYTREGYYARLKDPEGQPLMVDMTPTPKKGFMKVTRLVHFITHGRIDNRDVYRALGRPEELKAPDNDEGPTHQARYYRPGLL